MNVHFVCTGNLYRSRLAEAYLKSKELPEIEVSSSGILADVNYVFDGPIAWSAMRLIFAYSLTSFMSITPTQTTRELLDKANLVIFMQDNQYEFSRKKLGWAGENYEIWNVEDLDHQTGYETIEDYINPQVIPVTEITFGLIRQKVDDLTKKLKTV